MDFYKISPHAAAHISMSAAPLAAAMAACGPAPGVGSGAAVAATRSDSGSEVTRWGATTALRA